MKLEDTKDFLVCTFLVTGFVCFSWEFWRHIVEGIEEIIPFHYWYWDIVIPAIKGVLYANRV